MFQFEIPEIDYTRYSNRQLAAVPLAVLAAALLVIAGWWVLTGAPANLGIVFTGGTEAHLATSGDVTAGAVAETVGGDATVRGVQSTGDGREYIVTSKLEETGDLRDRLDDAGYEILSLQSRSASFGGSSQFTALLGVIAAFVGMSVLVFALFRTFVPSLAVVISAFSDMVIPIAVMNLLGVDLSLGTVAALLMLIGYSVDSDILLNNHILRRRGGFYESTYRAMQTGVTMTLTSLAAMAVMAVTAWLFAIPLLPQIGLVLVVGLSVDLMNTYMLNLSLLRWYTHKGVAR
ncbi:protein translocase subunit SecF [Halococcoides cellulosivorans]|uniref:Protein-export membrane protein SecF n=1 Tax=Halococcoides cellulosivorans TaxID=1679096 RepID=A0A2R4WYJ2_9EURY|nr:protein translocase subunit SecF [Halococcoides cellulosivorans]AWB26605.1 preprotein translocase subunit SecF [Halococcoides cellulosivorans]